MATTSPLAAALLEYLDAGFPGLWVVSREHEEAREDLLSLPRDAYPDILFWDGARGLTLWHEGDNARAMGDETISFEAALEKIRQIQPASDGESPRLSVVVFVNLDQQLSNPVRLQLLANYLHEAKVVLNHRVIMLSAGRSIPALLQPLFQVVDHPMPSPARLRSVALTVAQPKEQPEDEEEWLALTQAAAGLTNKQAENAFALSIARKGRLDPAEVFDVKVSQMQTAGLGLEILKKTPTFDEIGGLKYLKEFTLKVLEHRQTDPNLMSRGIVLIGVPGSGKSLIGSSIGASLPQPRPTVRWDIGMTMSKFVGESQHRMRQLLDTVDALAPCVLLIDELEKQIATGVGGGTTGGDVQTQMLAQWLTWHQEHTSDVFVVATVNNVEPIICAMPEMLHRFDEAFFLDLPVKAQREAIWKIHLPKFGFLVDDANLDEKLPNDEGWVGRDIWKCCRLSRLLGKPLKEVPIGTLAKQASETIGKLQDLADGRWMSVEYSGMYDRKKNVSRVQDVFKANGHARTIRRPVAKQ